MSVLLEKRANGVAVVTLNRPHVLNALDVPAKARLAEIWPEIAADPRVREVYLGENFDQPLDHLLRTIANSIREATPFQTVLISIYEPDTGLLRRVTGVGSRRTVSGGFAPQVAATASAPRGVRRRRVRTPAGWRPWSPRWR